MKFFPDAAEIVKIDIKDFWTEEGCDFAWTQNIKLQPFSTHIHADKENLVKYCRNVED